MEKITKNACILIRTSPILQSSGWIQHDYTVELLHILKNSKKLILCFSANSFRRPTLTTMPSV